MHCAHAIETQIETIVLTPLKPKLKPTLKLKLKPKLKPICNANDRPPNRGGRGVGAGAAAATMQASLARLCEVGCCDMAAECVERLAALRARYFFAQAQGGASKAAL